MGRSRERELRIELSLKRTTGSGLHLLSLWVVQVKEKISLKIVGDQQNSLNNMDPGIFPLPGEALQIQLSFYVGNRKVQKVSVPMTNKVFKRMVLPCTQFTSGLSFEITD